MYQLPFVHIDVFSTDMTIGELAANIMEKFPMPAIDPSRNINSYSFHMYEILGVISDVSAPGRKEQMFNANRQHGMANQFALQKKELRLAQRNALMKEIRGYIAEYRDRYQFPELPNSISGLRKYLNMIKQRCLNQSPSDVKTDGNDDVSDAPPRFNENGHAYKFQLHSHYWSDVPSNQMEGVMEYYPKHSSATLRHLEISGGEIFGFEWVPREETLAELSIYDHLRQNTLWSDPRTNETLLRSPLQYHLYTLANRTQIKFICATSMRVLDVRRYFDETITMEMLAKELLEEFIDENYAASLLGDASSDIAGRARILKTLRDRFLFRLEFYDKNPNVDSPGQHDVVTPIPHTKYQEAIKFVLRNSFSTQDSYDDVDSWYNEPTHFHQLAEKTYVDILGRIRTLYVKVVIADIRELEWHSDASAIEAYTGQPPHRVIKGLLDVKRYDSTGMVTMIDTVQRQMGLAEDLSTDSDEYLFRFFDTTLERQNANAVQVLYTRPKDGKVSESDDANRMALLKQSVREKCGLPRRKASIFNRVQTLVQDHCHRRF